MDAWIEELAAELGEDALTKEEVNRLLEAARAVAHRVERKITPLAAFLLGTAVGRAEASGMDRPRALEGAFSTMDRILPAEETASEVAANEAEDVAGPRAAGGEPPSPLPGEPRGDER